MYEIITAMCDEFERRAEKLGYTVEAVALYDYREDRHNIRWNDKAKRSEQSGACECVALALCMLANGDRDLIEDALRKAYIRTPQGSRKALEEVIGPMIKACLETGYEMGREAVREIKKQAPSLPDDPDKKVLDEGVNNNETKS